MSSLEYIAESLRPLAVAIADLTIDPKNARLHPEPNIEGIKTSLRLYGQRKPIVANSRNRVVEAGNGTVVAAQALGWTHLAVVWVDDDPSTAAGFAIADNRTAELAEWGREQLDALMREIESTDEGLVKMLDELAKDAGCEWAKTGEVVEDEVPEPPKVPFTQPGDLWVMGEHRLLCGDSTKADDVGRVMDGARADLCMTDPPYGADIQYASHNDTQDALLGLIAGFFPLAEKHCDVIALTPGINNVFHYRKPDWILCWFYAAGTGRTPWGFSAWQPLLVWGKDPKQSHGEGCHPDGYNWPMTKGDAEENAGLNHACPKPVTSWAKWMDRLLSDDASLVYDPFCGSGTTIIAAEQLGRRCYAMEIEPAYVDVALARWSKLTGKVPIRESDGAAFPVQET